MELGDTVGVCRVMEWSEMRSSVSVEPGDSLGVCRVMRVEWRCRSSVSVEHGGLCGGV